MYTAMQKAVNLVNQFVLFFLQLCQFLAQKASYADYRRFARVMHLYAFFANCSEAKVHSLLIHMLFACLFV